MAKTLGTIGNELNILFRAGTTWGSYQLTIKNKDGTPVNLTGYTFSARIKRTISSADIVASITVDPIDLPNGIVALLIPATTTSTIQPSGSSPYVWDMEMTDPLGFVEPLFFGEVEVIGNV